MSNKNKPLILVDTSYTSFYRFFATSRWYLMSRDSKEKEDSKEDKNNPEYDWLSNKIFLEKYEKMYLESIIKLIKKKVFANSNVIFCMDSPKESLWRTQLQCSYKGSRVDLSLKHNFKPVFKYTYDTIIPKILKNHDNIKSIRINKMEADDIIACICLHYSKINNNQEIYVLSGDQDFLQLGRENIKFINYKSKTIKVLTEEEAKESLHNKILLGDVSDCIPSIFPKGTKNKKAIVESKIKLKEYLDKNSEAKKQYELNQKMIDFTHIPKEHYNSAISEFNKLF
jgi:5'-3' exonuclease